MALLVNDTQCPLLKSPKIPGISRLLAVLRRILRLPMSWTRTI